MANHHHHHADSDIAPDADTATDPVCGMTVEIKEGTRRRDYGGETFHFCSAGCQSKFDADPHFYAFGNAQKTVQRAQPGTQYTCPMHPEIVRDEPGSCPICGMALEPMVPSNEPSEELTDFTRRMWISAAAAVPLVAITMGELVGLDLRAWMGHRLSVYAEFVLATPIVLWAALPFFRRGLDSFRNLSPNMWTLISLGVGAAYVYSLVATFAPGVFPEQYRIGAGVGTYYEAAVVIIALIFVGQVLELRARERTGDAIRELHALGLTIIMATVDNQRTADAVARQLGVDEVRAGVLPEDKQKLVEELRASGASVAMAGDGVNDAPTLAAADVGIAMSTGADVAVESAGITLMPGDLLGLVRARKLAVATLRNIRHNLFFAFVYNAAGVPIAAGILYPVVGLLLSPMIAAAAMSLSSVSVISNALRLRRVRP